MEEIRWPKEEKDSSLFLNAEITTFESPSTIKEGRLRSIARVIAWTVASASTSFDDDGSLIFSTKEASTFPWESRTTIPNLASSVSLKIAPSKLILMSDGGGGSHLGRDRWGGNDYNVVVGCASVNLWSICLAKGMTWANGKGLLLVQRWLQRDQIVHVIDANSSRFLSCSNTNLASSKKFENFLDLQNNPFKESFYEKRNQLIFW